LRNPQLEHAVKVAKDLRRQRHLPDDAALAALESLNTRNAAFNVDRRGRQGKHFRNARPAPPEHQAKEPYLCGCLLRGFDETPPLGLI
jgi:hypothetical protein